MITKSIHEYVERLNSRNILKTSTCDHYYEKHKGNI